MIIYIKNMVCLRCKQKVATELDRLGITTATIELGRVEFCEPVSAYQIEKLHSALSPCGLEVMRNKNEELVEQIKFAIVEMIEETQFELTTKLSEYLSKILGVKYPKLSRIFAEVTGISIRQFVISHRIELTKEMIRHNNQTLTEIALNLKFSSIGHLSNQFKQTTGIAPSVYQSIVRNGFQASLAEERVMPDLPPNLLIAAFNEDRLNRNNNSNKTSINNKI